jgi:hypothetical protein
LWLDPGSYVQIQLTLNLTDSGNVNYTKLRGEHLDPSRKFLSPGGGPFGHPFPSFQTSASKATTAVLTIDIPQDSRLAKCGDALDALNPPQRHPALVSRLRVSEWLMNVFERAADIKVRKPGVDCPRPPMQPLPPVERAPVKMPNPSDPNADAKLRAATVRAAAAAASGANDPSRYCEVALDTIQLSSKFELVADFSAGVIPLAKLFPVIPVPTVDVKADYFDSISLIFHGYNRVQSIAANKSVNRNRALGAVTSESDTASIVRELRSLRDATLLAAPR